jgi:hypothetical protein
MGVGVVPPFPYFHMEKVVNEMNIQIASILVVLVSYLFVCWMFWRTRNALLKTKQTLAALEWAYQVVRHEHDLAQEALNILVQQQQAGQVPWYSVTSGTFTVKPDDTPEFPEVPVQVPAPCARSVRKVRIE